MAKSNGASVAAPIFVPTTLTGTASAAVSPTAPKPMEGEEWQDNLVGETSGRKRHNTIVGLLRNTIRRQSVDSGNHTKNISPTDTLNSTNNATNSAKSAAVDGGAPPDPGATVKPRSLRFTFNSSTTSSKPPDDIVMDVLAAADKHSVQHRLASRYLIECCAPSLAPGKENLKFEVEICKLPRLRNLHGLRFKRLSGASSDYKDNCEMLLKSVTL